MIFGGVDMFDALLGEVRDRAWEALSQRVATKQQNAARPRHYFLRPEREYMRVFVRPLLNKQTEEPGQTSRMPAG